MSIDNVLHKLNQLEHYYDASVLRHGTSTSDTPNVPFTPFPTYKVTSLPGVQKLLVINKKKIREQEDENVEDQETLVPDMESNEGEDDLRNTKNLGRVYELKKIYSRLTSLESYLSNESAPVLSKLRSFVFKAIEMFEVIVSNFSSFSDRIDEIIIIYYKFLKRIYLTVRTYYRNTQKS